jgi:hypothetical protein
MVKIIVLFPKVSASLQPTLAGVRQFSHEANTIKTKCLLYRAGLEEQQLSNDGILNQGRL